ncbi:alpha/beta hydrolase family protein [Gilvibacter sediminis]|uniref:alpha/beta hydrolase family protein n=1 Tax=Gilvibacter sediminis TaxID=379071 RepID=UPI00234FE9E8|nr:alpha/beta hydrolase [Gilvibacter sediminis]MDC7998608.1 alpha/beta hydrolase [Gilvibacter sediminis]
MFRYFTLLCCVLLMGCVDADLDFNTQEVRFTNEKDGVVLVGELVTPEGEGPFPGVVLVAGSGEMDRDQSFQGHKFFKDVAIYLAQRGIASLRYDKRGVGESGGSFAEATLGLFAQDAAAAFKYLSKQAKIGQVGFIGQSEGGEVAPLAAREVKECAFMVLMAPPANPLDITMTKQMVAHMRANYFPQSQIVKQTALEQQIWRYIKNGDDLQQIEQNVLSLIRRTHQDNYYLREVANADLEEAFLNETTFFVNRLNHDYFKTYKDFEFYADIDCPVFAITGDKDLFVVYPEEFELLKTKLKASKSPSVTFKVYPNLNHLFQVCETGLFEEVKDIPTSIEKQVVVDIANWIKIQEQTN